jgi:nitroreductase
VPEWDDARIATLLGLDRANDFADAEHEIPELLAEVVMSDSPQPAPPISIEAEEWFGKANQLSRSHVPWPAIDKAVAATERHGPTVVKTPSTFPVWPVPTPTPCALSSSQLIRQRRSAVDFDAVTHITQETFLGILDATLPRPSAPPFEAWPFPPRLHLVVFVHRVIGLSPGMYLWLRNQTDEQTLRLAFGRIQHWEVPEGQSPDLPLRRLGNGDLRSFARTLSCQQDIAADGAFSLGMLAHFEPVLREFGASAWRHLFWEAGMIGQTLYLAAEAAGVRGTGIGCYFDDLLHDALGLTGHDWQSLYHFTVGAQVDDPRLSTAPPYDHLKAVIP